MTDVVTIDAQLSELRAQLDETEAAELSEQELAQLSEGLLQINNFSVARQEAITQLGGRPLPASGAQARRAQIQNAINDWESERERIEEDHKAKVSAHAVSNPGLQALRARAELRRELLLSINHAQLLRLRLQRAEAEVLASVADGRDGTVGGAAAQAGRNDGGPPTDGGRTGAGAHTVGGNANYSGDGVRAAAGGNGQVQLLDGSIRPAHINEAWQSGLAGAAGVAAGTRWRAPAPVAGAARRTAIPLYTGRAAGSGRAAWAPISDGRCALTAALALDSEADGVIASNPMIAGMLESLGRKSLATSEHSFNTKVRKLTEEASVRAAQLAAAAQEADTDEDRFQLMHGAFTYSSQIVQLQHTELDMVNMRAKGFKHATAAKVIAGPPEQRELVRQLTTLPEEIMSSLGGYMVSWSAKSAA